MTKEQLIALGLNEEQANKAIELHTAALQGYVAKGTYDVLKAEADNLKATNDSMKAEVDKLKKFEGTNAELAAKIEKLQGDVTTTEKKLINLNWRNFAKLMLWNWHCCKAKTNRMI